MKFFETAVWMADESELAKRSRSEKLEALRDAMHPTCLYYKFFDRLVCAYRPFDVIEIGTYVGTSAAHFAHSNYVRSESRGSEIRGQVVTIDVNPDAARCVRELGYPNITAITGNSLDINVIRTARGANESRYDVLYIDGNHTFSQAYREYFYYRELVREGGLILVDDAGLEMDGDEMNLFWDAIPEPKQRLDHLHPNVGFGVIEKTRAEAISPETTMEAYAPKIQARRKIHR
jgi:cephalosporin hydroxylase